MRKRKHEKANHSASDKLASVGGVALFGAIIVFDVALIGEAVDLALPQVDGFPGGTLGKIAGGLGVAAIGMAVASEVMTEEDK